MQEIVQAISTVGFPIVCTLMMGYLLIHENQNHQAEIKEIKESINANTLVMTELKQFLVDLKEIITKP